MEENITKNELIAPYGETEYKVVIDEESGTAHFELSNYNELLELFTKASEILLNEQINEYNVKEITKITAQCKKVADKIKADTKDFIGQFCDKLYVASQRYKKGGQVNELINLLLDTHTKKIAEINEFKQKEKKERTSKVFYKVSFVLPATYVYEFKMFLTKRNITIDTIEEIKE